MLHYKLLTSTSHFKLWQALPDLRVRINFSEYWNAVAETRPPQSIMDAIKDAGFQWVFKLGQVRHDRGLITAFIERWRPETHTFHLPFGEATITFEDVHHILGLPTTGRPLIVHGFTTIIDQRKEMIRDLLGVNPYERGDVRRTA